MYRSVFENLYRDLNRFDQSEPVMVTYDIDTHTLTFRQLNQVIVATYLSPFFFKKKGFKLGVLTQLGLTRLITDLEKLIGSTQLEEETVVANIGVLSTEFYRYFRTSQFSGPKCILKLRYVTITSKFITWIFCKIFSSHSKLVYELIKNEQRYLKTARDNSEIFNH